MISLDFDGYTVMIGRDPMTGSLHGSHPIITRNRFVFAFSRASVVISHLMPTIRDLVSTVRQREGVAAAVVLGRDGLLIDGQANEGVDTEGLAAMVPAVLTASEELGGHAGGASLTICVLEYASRIIIICSLTIETVLLVVATEEADIGKLLFELRRNRRHIAAIM